MSNTTGDSMLRALVQKYQADRDTAIAALTIILNNAHHASQIQESQEYLEALTKATGVLATLQGVLQTQAENNSTEEPSEKE